MSKIIIRTEAWNGKNGTIIKAVARHLDGTFIGATNQTDNIPYAVALEGRK